MSRFSICDVGLGYGFTLPVVFPPTYIRIQGGFIIGKLKFGMQIEADLQGGAKGLAESVHTLTHTRAYPEI